MARKLLEHQQADGEWRDAIDPHDATALACLGLLAPDGPSRGATGLRSKYARPGPRKKPSVSVTLWEIRQGLQRRGPS